MLDQVPYILRNLVTQSKLKNVDFINIKYLHCTIIFPTKCKLFKDNVLSSDNVLSGSCEEAKQLLKMLGVEYISYHACLNDYILYRDEDANKEMCPKCGRDRYYK